MEVPDSSSLLDSHRVVCPAGSGGGNSASEHILTGKRPCFNQVVVLDDDVMFLQQEPSKNGKRKALEKPHFHMLMG